MDCTHFFISTHYEPTGQQARCATCGTDVPKPAHADAIYAYLNEPVAGRGK